jgi:hypothetical protein
MVTWLGCDIAAPIKRINCSTRWHRYAHCQRRHIKQRMYDLHAIVLKMVEALSSPARRLPAYAKDAYKSVADNLNPEPPDSYPSRVLQLQLLWNGRPVNLAAGTSCCGCDHHPLPLLALLLEEHHRISYNSPSFRTMQSLDNHTRAQLLLTYSYTTTRYRRSIVVMAPPTLALTGVSASAVADRRACFRMQTLVHFDDRVCTGLLTELRLLLTCENGEPAEKYVLAEAVPGYFSHLTLIR